MSDSKFLVLLKRALKDGVSPVALRLGMAAYKFPKEAVAELVKEARGG